MFTVVHERVFCAPIGQRLKQAVEIIVEGKTFWHASLFVGISWGLPDPVLVVIHYDDYMG